MNNEIADRIAFFLKDFPPFSYLEYAALEKLAIQVTVRFLEENEVLFTQGKEGNDCCYVLRKGNIKLTQNQEGQISLVDQCEPGDIFGVRSILSGNNYVMSAECEEESLVYEIPKKLFLHHLNGNRKFAFFFASGYAAGQAIARFKTKDSNIGFSSSEQPLQYSKDLLTCEPEETIFHAAKSMSLKGVGSIVVVVNEMPVGIVTDTDLRDKVVGGNVAKEDTIQKVMSAPVKTIGPRLTYSEVLIKMMRTKTHHLIITEDGTDASKVIGIVSDHDLMMSQNHHPSALIKKLRRENNPNRWPILREQAEDIVGDYLNKELPVDLISNFITEINDTLIKNAIFYALEKIPEVRKIDFCWMSLGSEGREEQLLRTDQDNAIVFSDSGDQQHNQEVMLHLAEFVNKILADSGFEECPAKVMAKNPELCQPLSKWQEYFKKWINSPDPKSIMNTTIFFDYRNVYGSQELIESLNSVLVAEIKKHEIFLNHLAANALLNPAPLSFFKKFLVEKSGHHVDQFDIKKRAMMPLSDIARVLIMQYGVAGIQNTVDRYRKLEQLDPKNRELYEAAAQAYFMMMKIRAKYGLKQRNSGRFIPIDEMNKLEKQILKSSFTPIKELQEIMETRFQLVYFR